MRKKEIVSDTKKKKLKSEGKVLKLEREKKKRLNIPGQEIGRRKNER